MELMYEVRACSQQNTVSILDTRACVCDGSFKISGRVTAQNKISFDSMT
jgi:hypothetical protein